LVGGQRDPSQPGRWPSKTSTFRQKPDGDPEQLFSVLQASANQYTAAAFQIVRCPPRWLRLFEYAHRIRNSYTPERPPPGHIDWLAADSAGRWEANIRGGQLHFHEDTCVRFAPATFTSDELHVVERFHAAIGNPIHRSTVTMRIPMFSRRPWKMSMPIYRRKKRRTRNSWSMSDTPSSGNILSVSGTFNRACGTMVARRCVVKRDGSLNSFATALRLPHRDDAQTLRRTPWTGRGTRKVNRTPCGLRPVLGGGRSLESSGSDGDRL